MPKTTVTKSSAIITKRIVELAGIEKMHQQNFDTLADKVCDLQNQKHQLEQLVSRFKTSNKKYLKIKSVAEEVVDRLLAERKSLLSSALIAVVEALRMNPDRYAVIYNTIYDNDDSSSLEILRQDREIREWFSSWIADSINHQKQATEAMSMFYNKVK